MKIAERRVPLGIMKKWKLRAPLRGVAVACSPVQMDIFDQDTLCFWFVDSKSGKRFYEKSKDGSSFESASVQSDSDVDAS